MAILARMMAVISAPEKILGLSNSLLPIAPEHSNFLCGCQRMYATILRGTLNRLDVSGYRLRLSDLYALHVDTQRKLVVTSAARKAIKQDHLAVNPMNSLEPVTLVRPSRRAL